MGEYLVGKASFCKSCIGEEADLSLGRGGLEGIQDNPWCQQFG